MFLIYSYLYAECNLSIKFLYLYAYIKTKTKLMKIFMGGLFYTRTFFVYLWLLYVP